MFTLILKKKNGYKTSIKNLIKSLEWTEDFKNQMLCVGIHGRLLPSDIFTLIALNNGGVIVNLIPILNDFNPEMLQMVAERYQNENIKFVQLWEDVWITKSSQIVARLKSFSGLNTKLHGRKTTLCRIKKPIAQDFLVKNHLQGFASTRFNYGLYVDQEVVSVASFSSLRKMNHSSNYFSAELVRFAVKQGFTIQGALSKMIIGFSRLHLPNDIMSYIDKDWGMGDGFGKIGFEIQETTNPLYFKLNEEHQRTKITGTSILEETTVFNSGSIKMVLKF